MEKVMFKTRESVRVGCSNEQNLDDFISEVFSAVIDTFRFTDEEREDFVGNEVAQLVAAIPYVAGCEDAKRTALAHLAVYFTELRGGAKIGDHNIDDNTSVYTRLRLLSSFKGGDEKIIHHGMTILALVMLEHYNASSLDDKENGVYNPLNDAHWEYEVLKTNLLNDIRENPCDALDELIININGNVKIDW